jgi:SAM-dependent methyltransferase
MTKTVNLEDLELRRLRCLLLTTKNAYEFSHTRKAILTKMLVGSPPNCLDTGCGDGAKSLLFHDAIGIDISVQSLKKAKKNTGKNVILGDAHNLPIRDNSFSQVIMVEVIEHLSEPSKAILEVRRVLNNKGRILIQTPNRLLTRGRVLDYHVHEFTPRELIYLLKQCGIKTIVMTGSTIPYIPSDNKFTSKIFWINRNRLFFEIWKMLDRIIPIKWDIILMAKKMGHYPD